MFDLARLDCTTLADEGVELELRDPSTQEGTGVFLTIHGADSMRHRNLVRAQQDRRFQLLAKHRGKTAPTVTTSEMEADAIELLVGSVSGWRQGEHRALMFDGKALEFSPENLGMVYTRLPWVREQVDNAIHDRSLFFRN